MLNMRITILPEQISMNICFITEGRGRMGSSYVETWAIFHYCSLLLGTRKLASRSKNDSCELILLNNVENMSQTCHLMAIWSHYPLICRIGKQSRWQPMISDTLHLHGVESARRYINRDHDLYQNVPMRHKINVLPKTLRNDAFLL